MNDHCNSHGVSNVLTQPATTPDLVSNAQHSLMSTCLFRIQLFGLSVIIRYAGTGNTIGCMGYGPPYNIERPVWDSIGENLWLNLFSEVWMLKSIITSFESQKCQAKMNYWYFYFLLNSPLSPHPYIKVCVLLLLVPLEPESSPPWCVVCLLVPHDVPLEAPRWPFLIHVYWGIGKTEFVLRP